MKPIQTFYKGYHFRSRLEARWAVVFDHLEYDWEYEPEGFELESGRYLPDFWLPKTESWVEIKGGEPSEHDEKRFLEFTRNVNARGHRARMLIGSIPDPRHAMNKAASRIRRYDEERANEIEAALREGQVAAIDSHTWMPDPVPLETPPKYGAFGELVEPGWGKIEDYALVPLAFWSKKPMPWFPGGDIPSALAAGRAARFEHGRSGA